MSSNQYVNFAIALVVGVVVAVATWGTGMGLYYGALSYSLTSFAAGAIGGKKKGGLKDAAAGQLDIATATEAAVVPVVFGTAELVGNILRYDNPSFRAYPIKQKSGGKGGGGKKATAGYRYFLVFDYGLCMGPVDAIGTVKTSPGKKVGATGTSFSGDYQDLNYSGVDDGGEIRVYRGTATQTRQIGEDHRASGDSNYRHVCFAAFGLSRLPKNDPVDFEIGNNPAIQTYLFEVTRWPVVTDDAGTPIPGFQTRVTASPSDPQYKDANPMAILWESHANKIWGQGLSTTLLHTASWVAASQYFFDNKIGMSLVLGEQDDVSALYEAVRHHVALSLVWDGKQIRALVMTDRTAAYATRKLITAEMIVGSVNVTRPSWNDTANEVRAQFVDREGNYRQGIVAHHDLANMQMTGGIRSQKLDFPGFTHRETADLQALRILRELSVPRARLQMRLNRLGEELLPSDLIELVWNELNQQDVTTFWRVLEISDEDQGQEGIEVIAGEDHLATGYIGSGEAFGTTPSALELGLARGAGAIYQGDDHSVAIDPGLITPICVYEPNAWLTAGKRSFFLACERRSGVLAGVSLYWALDGATNYLPLGLFPAFAVSGTLLTALPVGLVDIDRSVSFDIALNDPADESELLSSANKVMADADHFDALAAGPYDLLLVGGELMLVGKATEPSSGVYRLTHLWRGVYGTARQAHSIGATCHFLSQVTWNEHLVAAQDLPTGANIDLKLYPYSGVDGESSTGIVHNLNPWLGSGAKPFEVAAVTKSVAGLNWTLNIRPRFHDRGSHISATLNDDFAGLVTALPSHYGIITQAFNGASPLEEYQTAPSLSFLADNGTNGNGGIVAFTRTVPASTTRLEVRQTLLGVPGEATSV